MRKHLTNPQSSLFMFSTGPVDGEEHVPQHSIAGSSSLVYDIATPIPRIAGSPSMQKTTIFRLHGRKCSTTAKTTSDAGPFSSTLIAAIMSRTMSMFWRRPNCLKKLQRELLHLENELLQTVASQNEMQLFNVLSILYPLVRRLKILRSRDAHCNRFSVRPWSRGT